MVQINFATREVSCKVVYYGPGLCGKTTNLQQVHDKAPSGSRGSLTSIATEGDRTLFFDFMPLELGTVAGMKTKFQLYTVPGQVYYNATRKIVLEGVDGIVFVADSSAERMEANKDSWENLKENLKEYGLHIDHVPLVLQFNKRDLPDAVPTEKMDAELNGLDVPTFEAVAITGKGVMPTLRKLSGLVLDKLNKQSPRRGTRRATAVQAQRQSAVAPAAEPVKAPAAQAPEQPVAAAVEPETPGTPPAPPLVQELQPPPSRWSAPRAPLRKVAAPAPTKAEPVGASMREADVSVPKAGPRITVARGAPRKSSSKMVLVIAGVLVILVVLVIALVVLKGG